MALRLDLARLRDAQGDYPGGLEDLRVLVSSSAAPKSDDLLSAAVLLLNIGEYDEAKRWFRMVEKALVEQEQKQLWTPLDENEWLKQFITCRQFLSLWIPDYEGHHEDVFREAAQLLPLSSKFSRLYEAGVLHRLGRSTLILGQRLARNDILERGADFLERAHRLAGQDANPYHDLWSYRAAAALHNPRADYYWDRAVEASQGSGEGIEAHRLFLEGRRYRMEKLFAAIEPLNRALDIWKRFPYPKGACDVLCELGLAYASIGRSQRDQLIAAGYFRAAERIAEARHFPILQRVIVWRKTCAVHSACTINNLDASLEELWESAPKLFQRYKFSVPDLTEQGV